VLVEDLSRDHNNGNQNYGDPQNLFNMNGKLFFSAQNPMAGYEPHYYTPCLSANETRYDFHILPSQTLQTTQTITAANAFLQGRAVNYFAGNSITLTPGFKVSAGAGEENVFKAEIKACY
jgi:hypothetical protein